MPNNRKPVPIDQEFGRLTVIGQGGLINHRYSWRVRCRCGVEKDVRPRNLMKGHTESCGCWRREFIGNRQRTHGRRNSPEYYVWRGIKARCLNSSDPGYKNYGQRGIRVCDGLRNSFEFFFYKVGSRPSSDHSIDRRENEGNYSCGECVQCLEKEWTFNLRWATAVEQNRNRRNNRLITIDGITKPFSAWCEIGNVRWDTASDRVERGWEVKRALGLSV